MSSVLLLVGLASYYEIVTGFMISLSEIYDPENQIWIQVLAK